MKYVGIDLHKQIIVLCVVMVVSGKRQVVARKRLACRDVLSQESLDLGLLGDPTHRQLRFRDSALCSQVS